MKQHVEGLAANCWVPPEGMTVHTLKLQQDAGTLAQEVNDKQRAAGFLGSLLVGC